jgi:hypothetical protein
VSRDAHHVQNRRAPHGYVIRCFGLPSSDRILVGNDTHPELGSIHEVRGGAVRNGQPLK